MNYPLRHIAVAIALTFPMAQCVHASNLYPESFKEFFIDQEEVVDVSLVGMKESTKILAMVNYDKFTLTDSQAKNSLNVYLKSQRIKSEYIERIISQLTDGVIANPSCDQSEPLEQCIPENAPGLAEFVYDFDNQTLRIFIESQMLEKPTFEIGYHTPQNLNKALINHVNLYAFANKNDTNFNVTNDTYLGLSEGYINLYGQYHDQDKDYQVQRGIYDVEKNGSRAFFGYVDQQNVALNSTDFFASQGDYSGLTFTAGNSRNLRKNNMGNEQRVYFFAPQAGQLEIYRGDALLLTRVVKQGEQSISYDELPTGSYTINLRLRQGTQILSEQSVLIVNQNNFNLAVKDFDYRLDAGKLDDVTLSEDNVPIDFKKKYSPYYGRAALNYRPSESLMLGYGAAGNSEELIGFYGGTFSLTDSAQLQYQQSISSENSTAYAANVSIYGLHFSYNAVNHENTDRNQYTLMQRIYGLDDSKEYGVTMGARLLGGNSFVSVFSNENKDRYTQEIDKYQNMSASWSRDALGGQLTLSTGVNKIEGQDKNVSFGLSWSFDFTDNLSTRLQTNTSNNQGQSHLANLTYQQDGDNWSSSTTAGIQQANATHTHGHLSTTADYQNDYFDYDAYAYVDTGRNASVSGSISGTQIVSGEGLSLTNKRGESFVEVGTTWSSPSPNIEEIQLDTRVDQNSWRAQKMNAGDADILPISKYSENSYRFYTESSQAVTDATTHTFLGLPGSFYSINQQITPLKEQIFVLNNIDGSPGESAQCVEDSCTGVEPVTDDGVIRVKYEIGKSIRLMSDDLSCLYDANKLGEDVVQAYCLPGFNQKTNKKSNVVYVNDKGFQFLGEFPITNKIHGLIKQLDKQKLTLKTIELNDSAYIYLPDSTKYSVSQNRLLAELTALKRQS